MRQTAGKPKYVQVKETLVDEIRSGRWPTGGAFPSEARLLEQFEVSRPTLIGALREMVVDGYLKRQQGRGTFVARPREPESTTKSVLPLFISDSEARVVGEAREVQLRIFQGVQSALESTGDPPPTLVVRQTPAHHLDDATRQFIDAHPPGIAFVMEPSFNPALWCFLVERSWTVWGLNEPVERGHCVYIDQERAGYIATKHLLSDGRTCVALLNGPKDRYWGFAARHRGYRRAILETGLDLDPKLMREDFHPIDSEAGRAMLRELLDAGIRPDGIVGASDGKALGAIAVAGERGINIPRDLAFVSIDNTLAERSETPLSAVAMPFVELGRQAVAQAMARSSDAAGGSDVSLQICLQPTLVERHAGTYTLVE